MQPVILLNDLLPELLSANHFVYCCVRDKGRFDLQRFENPDISVIEVDLLQEETLQNIPSEIDIAYYLVHSMSTNNGDFEKMEAASAENFKSKMLQTNVQQVIYLTGIVNESQLSKHLHSRLHVENILKTGTY